MMCLYAVHVVLGQSGQHVVCGWFRGVHDAVNTPESSTCCPFLLCSSSLHKKLPADLLHVQLDQTFLIYAMTDMLPDKGPMKSETHRSVVCFLTILLWMCDNVSGLVGWY